MCNLYSHTSAHEAIRRLFDVVLDITGNKPPLPGIYPNYMAPIVHNSPAGRTLRMARWGMPTPPKYTEEKRSDPGVTNVRNVKSSHWRRWLDLDHRCLVPFTSFSEPDPQPNGSRPPAWFALDESRPLACFAGIWTPAWRSVRKVREGDTINDLFAFLTCEPNAEVGAIHPKAMPVILRSAEEVDTWLLAPAAEALKLQRPLPDGTLQIVARGGKTDSAASPTPEQLWRLQ